MTFTKPSDITLWDALMNGWSPLLMVLTIGLGVMIMRESREVGFSSFKDWVISLAIIFWGLLIPLLTAGQILAFAVQQAKYENITQAFDITEDKFDSITKEHVSHYFEDDGFSDVRLTLTDNETNAVYEVTFGFKESGEPFVYDRADDVAFVESLKK